MSLTMLMTTGLLFVAMREVWRWNLASSARLATGTAWRSMALWNTLTSRVCCRGGSEINAIFATDDATWYVGHETIVAGEGEAGMAAWQRHNFAFMKRNCTHVINHYHLPSDRVVEISRRVAV
ncbi:TPA: hypothetical protein ACOEDZ_000309 [Enterobacter asburiae]